MRLMAFVTFLWRSIIARPLTTMYVFAGTVLMLYAANKLELGRALLLLALAFVVLLFAALRRENRLTRRDIALVHADISEVHVMVNNQHDELLRRVAQLTETLQGANVDVPAPHEPLVHEDPLVPEHEPEVGL